jgi:hypothetical protein
VKPLSLALLILGLCSSVAPPSLSAGPLIGFGGLAGQAFGYRNAQLNEAGFPRPDHLNALGGHIRIPAGPVEVAVCGLIEWRTLHYRDTLGGVDLATDQLSLGAGIRKTATWRNAVGYLGAGPAAYRLRFHLDPESGRTAPAARIKLGAFTEAGLFVPTPWPRVQVACGVRYSAVPGPGVRGMLVWVGFSIWPQQAGP